MPLYESGILKLCNGVIDYVSDTIKAALIKSTHTVDRGDEFFSDISADEVSGTGYTAGGFTLTTKSIELNYSTIDYKAANYNYAALAAGAAFRYIAIYDDSVANDPLIAILDCGIDNPAPNGGIYRIIWNSNVVFYAANSDFS